MESTGGIHVAVTAVVVVDWTGLSFSHKFSHNLYKQINVKLGYVFHCASDLLYQSNYDVFHFLITKYLATRHMGRTW